MARETAQKGTARPEPIVDRGTHPRTAPRLVLLAIILIAAAGAFIVYQDRLDNEAMLALLGVLAMMGIFFLVSAVIGFIQVMPHSGSDPLARAYLDAHPDGIVITDAGDRVIYANQAYARLTGASNARELQTVEGMLSRFKESTEAVYRLTNALRDGRADQEEFRLMRSLDVQARGEGAHWYRLGARPLETGRRGEPLRAWQLSDITREREDQERFFKELQHAIDYLDHAPAGFFSAGERGDIVYLNATLADWLGIDLARFRPGAISLDELVAGEGMSLIDSVRAEPGANRTAMLDLDMLKASGQSLPVTLLHRVSATRDGAPGESRTIVLGRGETGSAVAGGSAAEMRFTRFFNNTPMAIASVDADGRILRTNAPFLKMFSGVISLDEMDNGAQFEIVVGRTSLDAFETALAAARDGQGEIAPVEARHPGNDERHVRFYVNAVIDRAGSEPEEAAIIYAVETTEQKALENQMAQTQKMNAVGTLAGGIAHDFNNVLTAVLLSADHLLLSLRPSDASFADLMEIKRNANRAAVLVRQLLAFSRKQTMRPTVLQMTDVIGDLRMLVDRLTGTNVRLVIDYGRDLWSVKTDIGQFEQVVINLSVNARDAMPEGGTLTIRLRNRPAAEVRELGLRDLPEADYVLIEVEDEGSGIEPEVLEKIFEPFFTTKEVGKGTGLGLSMVYGIVKQSGGYIYPDSQVGRGTTFSIYLPRHIEEALPEGEDGAAGSPQQTVPTIADTDDEPTDLTGGSAVVLLVEDEEAVRRGGKRMLETRGYVVHEATSGVEALEVMRELDGQVDVVVSDVVMPEMDGPSLLRELRKDYPDLKFIFVSGYAEDAFAKNLPADAEFGFLAKPFSLKQLAVSVREILD
ncbi:cell cycle histidine kinase CckA [Pararhizobium mangrovi]|uniref:histidine kinase n=1 Tax=Pararhizobium mangrovi TaxID=2590452 RepID=A0A506UEA8_9HYPH|nr:ATP-binding protein [Pararhizobium mangrovi]TPW31958.1 response regulator [Pararhizobium mangrovi]